MAVLKGDRKSCDLVIVSNYDQKLLYMISHNIPEVTWVKKEKKVYSRELRKDVPYKFLRYNISYDYNYKMNNNDIADQLQLVYRMQRSQRNYKWWWALWLWGFEVAIVNAYRTMKVFRLMNNLEVLLAHEEFRKMIGYTLLDPDNELLKRKRKSPPEKKRRATAPLPTARSPKFSAEALCPNKG